MMTCSAEHNADQHNRCNKDDKHHHDIEDDEFDVVFEADHDMSRRSYDTDQKNDHEVQRLRLHEEDL